MNADAIAALMQSAALAQQQGDADEVVRCCERILALAPDHPVALNMVGVRALETGDAARASGLFRRAAVADPKAGALWMNLANACRQMGDDAGERAALDSALALDQTDFSALLRLAELHQRRGEDGEAVARWEMVLVLATRLPRRSAELEAVLERARLFVERHKAGFADAIGNALAGDRAATSETAGRRFGAAIDHMLGRRRIYANICEGGLHYPFLPADEFFDRRHFPWLAALEARAPAIRAEAVRLLDGGGEGFVPYVAQAPGTPANKWSSLDGSADWSAYYLWRYGERNDAACAACPETASAIEALALPAIPHRMPTVFFSVLRPHTRLPAHTGVTNTRAIIHLPLVVPEGCGFRVGDETRMWREGVAFAFDDTIEHEAWNDSDRPRIVLILDHWNPHLMPEEQHLLTRFFAEADATGLRPEAPAGS